MHETLGFKHHYELVGPVPWRQHEQPLDFPLRHEAARQADSQPWDSSLAVRMKTHAQGSRHSGGDRLPLDQEPLLGRSVTLPRSYIEKLEWQGNGDLSEGIRVLVEVARTPAARAALQGRIALLGIEGLLADREVKRLLALNADELLILILHFSLLSS